MCILIREVIEVTHMQNIDEDEINAQLLDIKIGNINMIILNTHIRSALKVKGMNTLRELIGNLR